MATKYQLSYNKARRQWRRKKKIDGKDRYFYLGKRGVAKGDYQEYLRALEEWRIIEADLTKSATDQSRQSLRDRYYYEQMAIQAARADPSNRVQQFLAKAVGASLGLEDHPDFAVGLSAERLQEIHGLVSNFVEVQRKRHEIAKLSAGRFDQIRRDAEHFRDWVIKLGIQPNEFNAATVEQYHHEVAKAVAAREISTDYAKTRWTDFKMLIEWAWEHNVCDLPRNLKSRRFSFSSKVAKIKTMPLEDYRELLDAAAEKTKLYLLLMLNCGMYQSDIANITKNEVTLGSSPQIKRKRTKTGDASVDVPEVIYPLWKLTASLMHQHVSADPVLWLTNENGEPLRRDRIEGYKLRRFDAVRSAIRRTQLKVKRRRVSRDQQPLPEYQLKVLRKTGAEMITQNPQFGGRIADLYLGHSPKSMREKHYSNAEQEILNQAVLWLGERVGA